MSDFLSRIARLSPQRLALLANELNDRLEAMEEDRSGPIAIIGMGCRLPGGVHNAESFWKLLSDGVDAIREVPSDRWNIDDYYDSNADTPGKMNTRWGGFIDGPDQFDPRFFGIAPAEANSMDPQQRLLLETTWEALEDAGIPPGSLSGSRSGVFVGLCNLDYGYLALRARRETITPYFASGLSHAIAAGRISYLLGLEGPSLAVDTSCSASLMAVHLACQSLRQKESELALAGGANLILTPEITIALSQSHMMAPDGRCKAFSDQADGFVRAEGSGILVLKRLRDAMRDGNRILAVIRGTAANQDGRSSGLTAPNGRSQEAVLAAALADAGLEADDIQYVETHGTGTSLGDPIEVGALGNVFAGRSSAAGPLRIGSVKSNFGHLESAAGIAGLIKLVLSLRHREIPATLHCGRPNHRIDWNSLPIRLAQGKEAWQSGTGRRIGGVSSFGFSGTNVHVIVEEHGENSDVTGQSEEDNRPLFFPVSAKTPRALQQVAARLDHSLSGHSRTSLASIARTLNTGRSQFECRAGFVAASREELRSELRRFAGEPPTAKRASSRSPQIAFLFADHECIAKNLGRELYETVLPFQVAIRRCESVLQQAIGSSLTSMLYPAGDGSEGLPASLKPIASFAMQYAMAELWRVCGIEPALVIGEGGGEFLAACVSGAISLEDALTAAWKLGEQNGTTQGVSRISWAIPKIPWLAAAAAVRPSLPPRELTDAFPPPLQRCLAALSMTTPFPESHLPAMPEPRFFGKQLGSSSKERLGDLSAFLHAAAELYEIGCDLDLTRIYQETPAPIVSLPSYPFERERYWIQAETVAHDCVPDKRPLDSELASDWIYELSWVPRSLEESPNASESFSQVIGEIPAAEPNQALLHLSEAGPRVNRLCASYVAEVLQRLGAERLAGQKLSADQAGQELGVAPSRRRIFARLLRLLAEDGILGREGDFYRFREIAVPVDVASEHAALQPLYPEIRIELDILKRCASKMAAVLQGAYDPMQLVFADGSIEEAEQIYQNSPVCRYFNSAACDVVNRVIAASPGRKIRILEIGAGTGATTASVLAAIAHQNVDYTFTDISPVFLAKARVKFSDFPGVTYKLLNIEHTPVEQGFSAAGYDIVLAANVLHATSDLRETVAHARELLRPGGLLMLIEGAWPDRWLDLTFGLTEGWWRFADYDLRPEHPLISVEKWNDLFRRQGMSTTRTVRYETAGGPSQQVLLLACADRVENVQPEPKSNRRWVILSDNGGIGKALTPLLQRAGENYEFVTSADLPDAPGSLLQSLRDRWPAEMLQVVYLCGTDAGGFEDTDQNLNLCARAPLQWMKAVHQVETANLWLVTCGAQARESCRVSGAFQAITWGSGRVFGLENPRQYKGLIDLDPDISPQENAALLFHELLHDDGEDQVAYRAEERLVPRVRRSESVQRTSSPVALRANGSYLVTGGLGAVGRRLVRGLAESGAGHIVVLSRGGLKKHPESARLVADVDALGSRLTIVEGDAASSTALEETFALFGSECHPLRGVFHAATVRSLALITELSEQQLLEMLHPKVIGTYMLHEWTKNCDLDFFVAFSSTTSILGSSNMAHYAAANQFLDSFAQVRRSQNLPMLSINWGAWEQDQDKADPASALLEKMGLLPMAPFMALQWLSRMLHSSHSNIMIANVDWKMLKSVYEARRVRPMLSEVDNSATTARPAFIPVSESPAQVQDREISITESVTSAAASVLGFRNGDTPPIDIPLTDLGLDSLMAVDLRNRLQTEFRRELPSTIVFDYPTISGLSAILESMIWVTEGQAFSDAKGPHDEVRI